MKTTTMMITTTTTAPFKATVKTVVSMVAAVDSSLKVLPGLDVVKLVMKLVMSPSSLFETVTSSVDKCHFVSEHQQQKQILYLLTHNTIMISFN
jgi:hypothetical protein